MNIQRFLIAITLLNLVLLTLVLVQRRPLAEQAVSPVLRGRALEIVDDQGRVRASIIVQPAEPAVSTASGKAYPETVILRLIDPNGRPPVKLAASEHGAGLGLAGDTDQTYVQLIADGASSLLKLTSKDGRQQLVRP